MVVEPDPATRESLTTLLAEKGHHITSLESGESALKLLHERQWDLIILSLQLPGVSGINTLAKILKEQPTTPIVTLSEPDKIKTASESIKMGAERYILKPLDNNEALSVVKRIAEYRICARENELLKQRLDGMLILHILIGKSRSILEIKEKIKTFGPAESVAMIYGEPGSGKGHLARALHANSPRRHMPFEVASLGSIPEILIESELFGHEKAAFTGSSFIKKGRFELADFGTIYLDEVGELSLELQAKLEQRLERKEFRRVDGTQMIRGDVRVICSSKYNLSDLVKRGQFREGLYRHLSSTVFHIPPLRERPEDIPLLADYFLQIFAARVNKRIKRISQRALGFLTDYTWPGNLSELQNAIERAVILARNDRVDADDLPFSIRGYLDSPRTKSIKEWEKYHIRRVLEENEWNISKSAKDLDIDRVTLYNKIKKYKLKTVGLDEEFENLES